MSRLIAQQTPNNIAKPLPIAKGGTGQKNAAMALQALGGIPADAVAHPLGPVPLNSDSKIPLVFIPSIQGSATLSIYGPVQAFCSVVTKYWLSDFDIDTTYTISATDGTVVINQNEIRYTPPATPGNYGFTINGRFYPVTAINSYVDKPTFTEQTLSRNILLTLNPIITHGLPDSLSYTDWEISDNPTFATTLSSASNVPTFKTSYRWNANAPATTYYARVRVHTTNGLTSAWSDPVQFTTPTVFYPAARFTYDSFFTSKITLALNHLGNRLYTGRPDKGQTGDVKYYIINGTSLSETYGESTSGVIYEGECVAISDDGLSVCSTAPGTTTNTVFTGKYNLAGQKILFSQLTSYGGGYISGTQIDITGSGDRIIVGSAYSPSIKLAVYKMTDHTTYYEWTKEADLIPSDGDYTYAFGYSVAISKDGTRAIVGAPFAYNGGAQTGAAYIFKRTGSTWAQETKIVSNNSAINKAGAMFGVSVDIDATGTRVFIGAHNTYSCSVYKLNGNIWEIESDVGPFDVPDQSIYNNRYNVDTVLTNDTGDTLVISTPGNDPLGQTNNGSVSLYKRINNVWTLIRVYTASVASPNSRYGETISLSGDGNVLAISFRDPNGTYNRSIDIYQ